MLNSAFAVLEKRAYEETIIIFSRCYNWFQNSTRIQFNEKLNFEVFWQCSLVYRTEIVPYFLLKHSWWAPGWSRTPAWIPSSNRSNGPKNINNRTRLLFCLDTKMGWNDCFWSVSARRRFRRTVLRMTASTAGRPCRLDVTGILPISH